MSHVIVFLLGVALGIFFGLVVSLIHFLEKQSGVDL